MKSITPETVLKALRGKLRTRRTVHRSGFCTFVDGRAARVLTPAEARRKESPDGVQSNEARVCMSKKTTSNKDGLLINITTIRVDARGGACSGVSN